MNIYRTLPSEFIMEASELFSDAFEDKFRYFFGSRSAIQQMMSSLINKEQVIAVVSDKNELVGIAGYSYKERHMMVLDTKAMLKQYGLIKGLYKILQLGIYFPNEVPLTYIYVDAITVKAEYRGKGISRLLFHELEKVAFENGLTHLQLDVSVDNKQAINAYKNIGFREVTSKTFSQGTARRIGIRRASRMLKILNHYLLDPLWMPKKF
ncbi:GNAT family N-acetyltransferase [Pedobacter caeni]|uniref:Acetyltransferase (GNAT) family protein n=1 Tax=Pedobacter caeni TaxID=288992 RepID=A0A1M5GJ97_9SPHI|nr:GNAT family N-acetyltransferase [Pedobacter caeni]SHG03788.1 Acetyltransferase (GNAT) family protein [Pedobacter caeni]